MTSGWNRIHGSCFPFSKLLHFSLFIFQFALFHSQLSFVILISNRVQSENCRMESAKSEKPKVKSAWLIAGAESGWVWIRVATERR